MQEISGNRPKFESGILEYSGEHVLHQSVRSLVVRKGGSVP
jgi:hypothetical protein